MNSSMASGSFWVIAQGIEATSTAVAPSGWFTAYIVAVRYGKPGWITSAGVRVNIVVTGR
jgi:hypothetical protein